MNYQIPSGITKTDEQSIYAIHNMISSIQHMTKEDIRNIDERSSLITIPIPHIDEANSLKNIIYTSIRRSFGFKDRDTKIGLIYCGDVGGTRSSLSKDLDWNNPHIHATMFLPNHVAPQSAKDHRRMNISLNHELLSIREVKEAWNRGYDIDVRKYDPEKGSLFDMMSYVYKAETRFIHQQANKFTTWTFPYDYRTKTNQIVDLLNPDVQNLLFKLHLYPEFILANPRLDRLTPIQLQCRWMYESASTNIDRRRIKQRFIRLVT